MKISSAIIVAMALCGAALAVSPAVVTHSSESDFSAGEFKATVVNSLGELSLARQVDLLLPAENAPSAVVAVVGMGDALYALSGKDTAVYRIRGNKSEKFAQPPGTMGTAMLATPKGELLVATGGDEGGVYLLDEQGKHTRLFHDENVKYVWAMAAGDAGIYIATGVEPRVYSISTVVLGVPMRPELIYQAPDEVKNILCLARSADGTLYAGTDEDGLVIQIDPAKKVGRVILDAAESEISAVVPDGKGGVFVATADAKRARESESALGGAAPRLIGAGIKMTGAEPAKGLPGEVDEDGDIESDAASADETGETDATETAADDVKTPTNRMAVKGAPSVDAPKTVQPRASAAQTAPATLPVTCPSTGPSSSTAGPTSATSQPAKEPATRPVPKVIVLRAGPRSMEDMPMRPAAPLAEGAGNAVYHVLPDGLSQSIFRKSVVILDMIQTPAGLVLATGNGGSIYLLDPATRQSSQLVNTDARQVTSLFGGKDGRILFGTSNAGSVGAIRSAAASEGVYTSPVLDATQIARWGSAAVRATVPPDMAMTLSTRTGNVAQPDEKTWSPWSPEVDARKLTGYAALTSPHGRFLQYRLALSLGDSTQTQEKPVVRQVEIVYQVGNLPPAISALSIQSSSPDGDGPTMMSRGPAGRGATGAKAAAPVPAQSTRNIRIAAVDPNNDELSYELYYRQVGWPQWVKLADKLTGPSYSWDTRSVPDGSYELKAVVSDAPSNPATGAQEYNKVSPAIVVDNTPPTIENFAATIDGAAVNLSARINDPGSRVASMAYSVDSTEEWHALLPQDGLADSQVEAVRFALTDLKPGPHVITLRATDALGNTRYSSVPITTP